MQQRQPSYHLWAVVCLTIGGFSLPASAQLTCAALLGEDFATTVDAPTQLIAADPVDQPGVARYCRIQGYVSPQVGFELRIPTQTWNQRLLFQGCGGFCGQLEQIEHCNDALARGYACVTTDLGHKGMPLEAKWAYNNRSAEIDFYYRATHVTTLAAKAIVERMKGQQPNRSYMRGCSTGGRQGLIAAQRFPTDFDGVIAGAPAGVSSGGALHLIWSALANKSAEGAPILAEKDVQVVEKAVLNACDAGDSAEDGIIADPTRCHFDPASLACGQGNAAGCLSDAEGQVVKKIYSGAVDEEGNSIYRGVPMPGSEAHWVPAYVRDDGPAIYYFFGGDFFRYLGFETDPGPHWRPEDFDRDRDLPRLSFMRMFNYAANPDLTTFKDRGGKIIVYQGWSDQSVAPLGTVEYWELAQRTMGGAQALSDVMRLYMLPGVQHCRGGDGADTMDLLTHLENWVERDQPPQNIVASKLKRPARNPIYPLDPANIELQWTIEPYPGAAKPVEP